MLCLESNRHRAGQQEIFQRLNQRRAELALVLIQRLVESSADKIGMKGLLASVWETIKGANTSFERAHASGDIDYYRTLLRLLFLALRIHASDIDQANVNFGASTRLKDAESVIPIAMEFLERVVAIGIRDLATLIHDKPTEANPEDIALLTGKSSFPSIIRRPK
jgi:nuclear pore complex protein Nup188